MAVKEEDILGFNFFQYGSVFFGECKGMRYSMARNPLKNVVYDHDPHKNDEALMEVTVWRGPLNSETTKEEKTTTTFPFTEEGRAEAINWLNERYSEKVDFWAQGTSIFPKKED